MIHQPKIWMSIIIALAAMGGTSAQAGFLSIKLDSVGISPSTIDAGCSSPTEQPTPAQPDPDKQLVQHQQIDLCEPGGVGAPNYELTNGGSSGASGALPASQATDPNKTRIVCKMTLATNTSLPPPLSHRLFRPPR